MTLTEYTLNDCVAAFNRRSPKPKNRRTVQRWMERKGIKGFGSSRHNWFYPAIDIETALDADFGHALPWDNSLRPIKHPKLRRVA